MTAIISLVYIGGYDQENRGLDEHLLWANGGCACDYRAKNPLFFVDVCLDDHDGCGGIVASGREFKSETQLSWLQRKQSLSARKAGDQ
jgi:hypothetical protein